MEDKKHTLVINAFGGPGAGKTTACMKIAATLKKRGLVAEYVQEYAKELAWEGRNDLLDGSESSQRKILEEQYNRMMRLEGKVDAIITDAPLLLNTVYNKQLTPEYEKEVVQKYNEFNNFVFVVQRDADASYEQDGRLQTSEEAKVIDEKIKELLQNNGIQYGVYSHSNIGKVAYNAQKIIYATTNGKVAGKAKKPPEQLLKKKEDFIKDRAEKMHNINMEIRDIAINYTNRPERIAELLVFGTKFHSYSVRNSMLILRQNRGATFVKSFAKWKEEGCSVKRGEKGLKVLAPAKTTLLPLPGSNQYVKLSEAPDELKKLYKEGKIEAKQKIYFKEGHVFDISQTDFPKEKYPDYYNMGYNSVDKDVLVKGISNFCKQYLKMPVENRKINSISLRGFYDTQNKFIGLNHALNSSEKLSTLTHELGHAVMDHSAFDLIKNTYRKEFEADCFSIMLSTHLGEDITEGRKAHLADNFRKMDDSLINADEDYLFEDVVQDVFNRYHAIEAELDKHIEAAMEMYQDKDRKLEAQNYFNKDPQIQNIMQNSMSMQYPEPDYSMQM